MHRTISKSALVVLLLSSLSFAQGIGGKAGVGGKAGFGGGTSGGGGVTFSRVSTTGSCQIANVSCNAVVGATPTAGDLILCGVGHNNTGATPTVTVTDSASNSLTQQVHEADAAPNTHTYLFWETATGGITATFTVTIVSGTAVSMTCGMYHRTSGVWTFDVSAVGQNSFTGSGAVASAASSSTTGTSDLLIGIADESLAQTSPSWTPQGSWATFGNSTLGNTSVPYVVLDDQLNKTAASYTYSELFAPAGGGITWTAIFGSFK